MLSIVQLSDLHFGPKHLDDKVRCLEEVLTFPAGLASGRWPRFPGISMTMRSGWKMTRRSSPYACSAPG